MICHDEMQEKSDNKGRVVVSVVLENDLIQALDNKAKSQDLNRSQLLRRMIREDLMKAANLKPATA